ncbi:MAG: LysM peptidoglycan-binding domain-containing protein [Candidatus Adiutrix sp.]|jgi:hypothetical protein|nr:LysM peptidoglycan-binding domain-containing protein [Candidatus Adiutrix sp.]
MKRIILMIVAALVLMCAPAFAADVNPFGPAEAYVVQKGDTASSIARKFYGKPALGPKLWQANKSLVAHPRRLTTGDTIYIFPEATLTANKTTAVPPPPLERPTDMYDRGQLYRQSFPKYFNFVADSRGLGESGSVRVRVKKNDPVTGQDVDEMFEVREVGHIIASEEHPGLMFNDGAEMAKYNGKIMLSTNDEVTVQFSEDVAKILDADTYGDSDPYFREFPIYGMSYDINGSRRGRVDYGQNLGNLYQYKGLLTIVARIDGLAPVTPASSKKLKKRNRKNQDIDPVSYVARITYSVDAVSLNDSVFLFVPLNPGPERTLEPPFVEEPDSYVSLGD